MTTYQIGTLEPGDVVGSRAAVSIVLDEVMAAARRWSELPHISMAWVRPWTSDTLGDPIAVFKNGVQVEGPIP